MKSPIVLLYYVFIPLKNQLKESLLPEFWIKMEKNRNLEPQCLQGKEYLKKFHDLS